VSLDSPELYHLGDVEGLEDKVNFGLLQLVLCVPHARKGACYKDRKLVAWNRYMFVYLWTLFALLELFKSYQIQQHFVGTRGNLLCS
jgi:hypothetical protein